jgi:hypothetical protein
MEINIKNFHRSCTKFKEKVVKIINESGIIINDIMEPQHSENDSFHRFFIKFFCNSGKKELAVVIDKKGQLMYAILIWDEKEERWLPSKELQKECITMKKFNEDFSKMITALENQISF